MTDTAAASARDTVAYWVLVELRAATAQAKTHTVQASERYVAADHAAALPLGDEGDRPPLP